MILTKEQKKEMAREFAENGHCNIFGFGTLLIKPARKGKINGVFGSKPVYKERFSFRASNSLKEQFLKKWKRKI